MSYDYDDTQVKIASAMGDVAEAWAMEKMAGDGDTPDVPASPEAPEAPASTEPAKKKSLMRRAQALAGYGEDMAGDANKTQRYIRRGGSGLLGAGALYGGYRGIKAIANRGKKKQEKKASVSDMIAWELEKIATKESGGGSTTETPAKQSLMRRAQAMAGYGQDMAGKSMTEKVLRRGGSGLLGAGALYGGYRGIKALTSKKKQEKKASLFLDAGYEALAAIELCEPEEFAKEAEFRAAEILAANGVHPETFEDIHPEEIKVASFPGVEYAADEYEAAALEEYNDMLDTAALHIIENLLDD